MTRSAVCVVELAGGLIGQDQRAAPRPAPARPRPAGPARRTTRRAALPPARRCPAGPARRPRGRSPRRRRSPASNSGRRRSSVTSKSGTRLRPWKTTPTRPVGHRASRPVPASSPFRWWGCPARPTDAAAWICPIRTGRSTRSGPSAPPWRSPPARRRSRRRPSRSGGRPGHGATAGTSRAVSTGVVAICGTGAHVVHLTVGQGDDAVGDGGDGGAVAGDQDRGAAPCPSRSRSPRRRTRWPRRARRSVRRPARPRGRWPARPPGRRGPAHRRTADSGAPDPARRCPTTPAALADASRLTRRPSAAPTGRSARPSSAPADSRS